MSAPAVNGITATSPDALTQLIQRLLDPQDRERYGELLSYIRSLPPHDEFLKVAQLLGYLTLIGRDLPQVLAEEREMLRECLDQSYAALQQEVRTNAGYHEKLQERLSKLPEEIAAGVKPADIAKTIGEAFRQQIAATGLQETKTLLDAATHDLQETTNDLDAAIQPITKRYDNLATKMETQAKRIKEEADDLKGKSDELVLTANRVNLTNAALQKDVRDWKWQTYALAIIALLVIGFVFGMTWEQGNVGNRIGTLESQIAELQQSLKSPPTPAPPLPKTKTAKQPKH